MVIYNITIKVEWSIAEDWLQWMKKIYLPEVEETRCFEKQQLVRLLGVDETDGPTYAAQFYARTLADYDYYLLHHASYFSMQQLTKWGKKYVHFDTLMKIIE